MGPTRAGTIRYAFASLTFDRHPEGTRPSTQKKERL